jgi:general secretion pathway protein K
MISPRPQRALRRAKIDRRRQGVALVMVLTIIAVITVFIAELTANTTTAFQIAVSERDRLKAEYIAKSGLNLTRLLIAREPQIRQVVAPLYQMVLHRNPPQINVWTFADQVLAPFANFNAAKETGLMESGVDFSQMKGLKDTGGSFEVLTIAENTRLNLNNPLYIPGPEAPRSVAMQLYAMMGGFQTESPYDSMFNQLDPDGQLTTRLDIVSDVIDWWDLDEQRTTFDPGSLQVAAGGGEDDVYRTFPDPYLVKNAAFDSLEELRMIRGVSDDFWATFVDPNPEDPRSRHVTVYGSGAVNPNDAPPGVLLARLCSFVAEQPLCQDPVQAMQFTQLLELVRSLLPIPLFTHAQDFLQFMQGKGELYGLLGAQAAAQGGVGATPQANPLLAWTPIVLADDKAKQMTSSFVMGARIFTIQSTGRVGHTSVRISSVVNFDDNWTPPPMSPGRMTSLGIFHHYRVD